MSLATKYFIKKIPFLIDAVPLLLLDNNRTIFVSANKIKRSKKIFLNLSDYDKRLINIALGFNIEHNIAVEKCVSENKPCRHRKCWLIRHINNYDQVNILHLCDGESLTISIKKLYRNKKIFNRLQKSDQDYLLGVRSSHYNKNVLK